MTIELTEVEHPLEEEPPPPDDESSSRLRWIALGVVVVIWVVLGVIFQGDGTQALPVKQLTAFQEWLNELRDTIETAKFKGNPIFLPIDWISEALDWIVNQLQNLFVSDLE